MPEIKIKSWNECPIGTYRRLVEVMEDPALGDYERAVAKTAILCGCSEAEIWDMPMAEASKLFEKTAWTGQFDFDKELKFKKIKVGKYTCKVDADLTHFTVAQYMDFQAYWNADKGANLENLLTVFLIPEGKKYGTDYDIADLKEEITWNMPLTVAQSVCFFFLKELVSSMQATLIYLDYQIGKMERKAKDPKTIAALKEKRQALTELSSFWRLSKSFRI